MTSDLEHLRQAQELDRALAALHERLERLPARRAAIDRAVADARAAVASAEARLKEAQKSQRDAAKDAEALIEQERRFQVQLTQVKKNEEYQALLHEIEGAKRKRSDLETVVLSRMEEEGALAAEIARAKQALAAAESKAGGERGAVDADEAALRSEEAGLVGRRDAALAALAPGVRARYERVRGAKRGQAVVELVGNVCAGCGAELPPQKSIEIRRGTTIVDCPDCGRLLVPAGGESAHHD